MAGEMNADRKARVASVGAALTDGCSARDPSDSPLVQALYAYVADTREVSCAGTAQGAASAQHRRST